MKALYALIGTVFFFLEILIYEWSYRLWNFWTAHKGGLGGQKGNLCQNFEAVGVGDSVGNCLDFKWYVLVSGIGLFAIKIIVLTLFIILASKKKTINPGLLVVVPYLLLILSFHFDLIPVERSHELNWWLELGNAGGIFAASVIGLFVLITSITYFYKKKDNVTNPM